MTNTSEKFQKAFECHKLGKIDEAEMLYTEILKEDENNSEILNLVGMINLQKFKLGIAEEYIQKAISISPEPYFYECLAKVYLEMEDSEKAIAIYKVLLGLSENNFNYLFNLASAYKLNNDIENAIETYKKAIEAEPNNPDTYFNLATIYDNIGQPQESVKYYKEAIKLNPEDMETGYFTALSYFKNRDYKHGLPYFENRLCRQSAILTQANTYPNLFNEKPVWQGEIVKDKTIYTYYEAGFGDVLMFARYLPLLQERCRKIIFKPQTPLVELFEYNFPEIEIIRYFKQEKDMNFDYHIPMFSLPYAMGLDETNMFAGKSGYLKADPEITERYKKEYFDNNCFKIGIKWRGNTHYEMDRVIDIKSFTKLFDLPNTKFYSFQTGEGSEDLDRIKDDYDIQNIGKTFNNFADTAGAIENMDLIICNDTSLAHLAGAMHKNCWIILPYLYNWRWHLDLTKCDWYDTVKLYRQEIREDWDEVFDKIFIDLKSIL